MSELDDILRRSREARERILNAGKKYEAQVVQRARHAERWEAERTQRAVRRQRLDGLKAATPELRAHILTILNKYDMYWQELVSHGRRKHLALPRAEVYAYLRSRGWSYPRIGQFCDRDPTSIMAALRRFYREYEPNDRG